MESKKIENAKPVDFTDNNIRFEQKTGHLIINNERYVVDYFPAGSQKAQDLNAKQREQITQLAMKILMKEKPNIKTNQLEGLTITEQGIKVPTQQKVIGFKQDSKTTFIDIKNIFSRTLKTDKERLENEESSSEISLLRIPDQQEPDFNENHVISQNRPIIEEKIEETEEEEFKRALEISEKEPRNKVVGVKFDDSALCKKNKEMGWFEHKGIKDDGNCLFNAIRSQVDEYLFQDDEGNDPVKRFRFQLALQLDKNFDKYVEFLPNKEKGVYSYVLANPPINELWNENDINSNKSWGGPIEMRLAADYFKRPVVFLTANCTEIKFDEKGLPTYNKTQYSDRELSVFGREHPGKPIYLYYNGSDHYDALSFIEKNK